MEAVGLGPMDLDLDLGHTPKPSAGTLPLVLEEVSIWVSWA